MFDQQILNRRHFLGLGVLGGLAGFGLNIAPGAETRRKAKAKNVLVILEQGGLSHIDTWDPKPEVLVEHRSVFKPIDTKVPGMRFTELLAKTSRVADKLAVVRSMHHAKAGADAHPSGTQYALSGSHPVNPLTMPDIGSVVSQIQGSDCKYLPPYIMVPGNDEQSSETRTGFLPAGTKVFKTGGKDLSDPSWRVEALLARAENSGDRLGERQRILSALDNNGSRLTVGGMDHFYEQAFDMVTSPKVSAAFDLSREPVGVREKYGAGHRGACYLIGRKLIESGVRFVTVDARWPLTRETPGGFNLNWDHHDNIYAKGSCGTVRDKAGGEGRYGIGHWCMMGSTDHAFAGLIEDMDQRGLLAETLVCFVSEFGRTPRVNKFQGRDHWAHAYSIVFAGAGVPGGQVIGSSDKEGGYAGSEPHTPEDYAATIYEKLGIDRNKPIYTSTNRPVFFGHGGEPIASCF